jgi:hypothetical protein
VICSAPRVAFEAERSINAAAYGVPLNSAWSWGRNEARVAGPGEPAGGVGDVVAVLAGCLAAEQRLPHVVLHRLRLVAEEVGERQRALGFAVAQVARLGGERGR